MKETFCTDIAETVSSIIEPMEDKSGNPPAVVVFRGTAHLKSWLTNIQLLPKAWIGGGYVHGGFADAHEEAWAQLASSLDFATKGSGDCHSPIHAFCVPYARSNPTPRLVPWARFLFNFSKLTFYGGNPPHL